MIIRYDFDNRRNDTRITFFTHAYETIWWMPLLARRRDDACGARHLARARGLQRRFPTS